MLETFIELLDGLYWDGYAQQLSKENPQAFTNELQQFCDNYQF